jgi:hypothetical protein
VPPAELSSTPERAPQAWMALEPRNAPSRKVSVFIQSPSECAAEFAVWSLAALITASHLMPRAPGLDHEKPVWRHATNVAGHRAWWRHRVRPDVRYRRRDPDPPWLEPQASIPSTGAFFGLAPLGKLDPALLGPLRRNGRIIDLAARPGALEAEIDGPELA